MPGNFIRSLPERDTHSHVLGQSCPRFVEIHYSSSRVMLTVPVVRSSPFSQRGEMEVCPSTPLLSRSSVVPIRLQNGFCVRRKQDLQLREEFLDHLLHDGNSRGTTDKSNITNIALVNPAVTEAFLHKTRGISPHSTPQTVLSTTREINAVEKGVNLNGHLRQAT